jgi:DNA polymerase III sliding clamp (beta) subunit (PCNA family)
MKKLAQEIMEKYSEKEIKALIKLLTPKKEVKVKEEDYIKMLYSVIQKNTIRPILEFVKATPEKLIASDLDNTLIINNKYDIPAGVFNKQHLELKNYPNIIDVKDYPAIMPFDRLETINLTLSSEILYKAITKALYCAGDAENISLNGVRLVFIKDKLSAYATDLYRMTYNHYDINNDVDLAITVPEKTCKILLTCLKGIKADVKIMTLDNKIEFHWNDNILMARTIEMAFPNVNIVNDLMREYKAEFDKDVFENLMKQVAEVTKDNQMKHGFTMEFIDNNVRILAVSDKVKIDKTISCVHNVKMENICMNSKFILEYLKSFDEDTLVIDFGRSYDNPFIINNEYVMMPLKI